MTEPSVDHLRVILTRSAGGYFRNPLRERLVTCSVCTTPVDGFERCFRCHEHRATAGELLADRVGIMTYAIAGRQSGYVMRGYKSERPPPLHQRIVASTLGLALHHTACVEALAGTPIAHWASVPSLAGRQGEHQLHHYATRFARTTEVQVAPRVTDNPRGLSGEHFHIAHHLPENAHILLIDDTWTTGGHAQSLALALRAAVPGRFRY
ncbi:hypothetical protein [Sciscionella marina]|uniref:hypothetical protein n=1 Tax=Sciscionella marina TaxID=508770 RepID=UPI0012F66642|nr:hypothetical protein [Sciscionella marina]